MPYPTPLEPSRFVPGRAMLLSGLRRHHPFAGVVESIAAQWREFRELVPLPRQRGDTMYGVLCGADLEKQTFEYMTGVEVAEFDPAAAHLGRMRVPAQHYAVFEHTGPTPALQATWQAIWNDWLPRSGRTPVDGPELEMYGERFDPDAWRGVIEVWSPMEPD